MLNIAIQFLSTIPLLAKGCEAHAKYLLSTIQIYLPTRICLLPLSWSEADSRWGWGRILAAQQRHSSSEHGLCVLMGDDINVQGSSAAFALLPAKRCNVQHPLLFSLVSALVTLYCWLSKPTVNERWWTWKWSEPHMDKIHIWVTARTSDSEPAGLTIIQVDNSGDFNRLGCFFTEKRKLYFSDNWLWPLLKDTVVLRLPGNQLLFFWNQSLRCFW